MEFQSEIEVAFVYGSFAQAAELVDSDIDLMIVGTVGLAELSSALRDVQNATGREVKPVIYSPSEIRKKFAQKDRFLTAVADASKIFLLGAESDMAKALSPEQNQKSFDQQARD